MANWQYGTQWLTVLIVIDNHYHEMRTQEANLDLIGRIFRKRSKQISKHLDGMRLLNPEEHWLEWLGNDPRSAVYDQIEKMFREQRTGATLERLTVTSKPCYLTGGKESFGKILVIRAGIAVPFDAVVLEPNDSRQQVHGVFSWVAVNLDKGQERQDRTWLDLGDDSTNATELLEARIYFDRTDSM